ncbi:MarR family winged helix-turn-helix transcriptional regulator [Streptomyces paludis]|uniref:MarR family transcriptional regulator n=1 Tax=Streptomyces paludis TaxID=2282738 RepID=A0A345HQM9_9ACTN|nr:MarR family transcriptional regulator [Streptomyces paludis]AXG79003.1 MarR family transcriptional regulator [Streptomyces paludis]
MAATKSRYTELARQLSAVGAVKRGLARVMPSECPAGSAAVLTLLDRHGEMRLSRLSELLALDTSVTSRHVAHLTERGWIERLPDPADKRSRILRLTPVGRAMVDELSLRATELFAQTLDDWTDDEVGQLNTLLARLRHDFGDRRDWRYGDQRPVAPADGVSTAAVRTSTTRTPRTPAAGDTDT